nr:hypothetical protein F46A8.2 - Caenorhabditis elegans [Caenorhabditis elegans]
MFNNLKGSLHLSIFNTFANVRLDTRQEEEINYHNSIKEFNTSVYAHLPDPSLSYGSSSVGSNSLKNVETFYDNSPFSVCGSVVVILSKQNPNEVDITNLVAKIRSHHGIVYVIASNNPSGGSQPLTLNESSKTNGLTDFRNDDQFCDSLICIDGVIWPVSFYAVNPVVSGNGSTVLPPLFQPQPSKADFSVTVQNLGPIDTFHSFYLSWYNATSSKNGGFYGHNYPFEGNHVLKLKVCISATLECIPSDPKTFLFAYSNDLEPSVVVPTFDVVKIYIEDDNYNTFARVRFDTHQEEEIDYYYSLKDLNTSILDHLPDPSLGFGSSSIGSDSLNIVEKFYNSTQFSTCGSIVLILSKRNPDENDISKLIAKVRSHHGMVHVIASNTPSGGSQPLTLYDLSSKTNGLADFRIDDEFDESVIPFAGLNYPIVNYAVNPLVSGNGSTVLPPLYQAHRSQAKLTVTVQNHGTIDALQSFDLFWYNASSSTNGGYGLDYLVQFFFEEDVKN